MDDRQFLFETLKKEVEFLLKQNNLVTGLEFKSRVEEEPDSYFNIIMKEESPLLELFESGEPNEVIDDMEAIFEKYDLYSLKIGNILTTLPV